MTSPPPNFILICCKIITVLFRLLINWKQKEKNMVEYSRQLPPLFFFNVGGLPFVPSLLSVFHTTCVYYPLLPSNPSFLCLLKNMMIFACTRQQQKKLLMFWGSNRFPLVHLCFSNITFFTSAVMQIGRV